MGSIRGIKKRKKEEEKDDQNALATSLVSQPKPLDWWKGFSQRIAGPLSKSMHSMTFESVFKISRKTFNYICSLVKDDMLSRSSNLIDMGGKHFSVGDQVAVALRRLSSGESLSSVGESFGISRSTVSQITWRFVEAMEERGLHHLDWPSTELEMKEIKSKFENIWGLPNCCGAVDITHVMMTLPTIHSSDNVWLDQEKNCSMILQAIVDPDLRFRDIVTGWPGSLCDDSVLQSSNFFKLTKAGKRLNGSPIALPEGTMLREYIVGDAGFPLFPWLLTPYNGKNLSDQQLKFNKRHVATRMVAKRALARLKELWKIIEGVMWKPDKHKLPRIVLVCCLLHNIVIDLEDEVQDDMSFSHDHDSGYHQQTCEFADKTASLTRDKLSLYLSKNFVPR
ncbi:Harbinger transposase-derived nuclease [Quillaja saponaria]|uniref:Harbinger transposase-derived nuclease n=1 Tax=Quillaja saponaria TaxID=32244 RepID=A0AAD7VHH9_QUISA|nr:Harbinger transposase-derived nuclease [Quillaja saponaria]KAJ7975850.1 Harbinger transposase-derived nuclease [Quillaja saponaria]